MGRSSVWLGLLIGMTRDLFAAGVEVRQSGPAGAASQPAHANAANLPLALKPHLPKEGWKYEGTFHAEGVPPMGVMMRSAGKATLTVVPSERWPVGAGYELEIGEAEMLVPGKGWVSEDTPPGKILASAVRFDRTGRCRPDPDPATAGPGRSLCGNADCIPRPGSVVHAFATR